MKKQTALITGGAKRIGFEIAQSLAAKGYDIVISYNNSKIEAEESVIKITEKYKVNCQIIKCDLKKKEEVKNLAKFMDDKNWNILINNASIFNPSKFNDEEELDDNFNIHFFAPTILSKALAEQTNLKDAQIINIIDKNIARFETKYFYYLLSKKSLAELTKMMSLQLAPEVRVNGIAPGFILSEENTELRVKDLDKKIPLKRKGNVKNITQTIDFLLENDFVTGQIISIDGGASLNHAG